MSEIDPLLHSSPEQRRLSILVVDDDPQVLRAVTDILNIDDHEVSTAEDGRQALAQLSEKRFDLLITDLGMPGMSGIELACVAEQLVSGMKVVILTGYGARISPEERSSYGIIGVIDKPFKINELQKILRSTH